MCIFLSFLSLSLSLRDPPSISWMILAYPSRWMMGVRVWDWAARRSSSNRACSSAERACTAGFWCTLLRKSVRLLCNNRKYVSGKKIIRRVKYLVRVLIRCWFESLPVYEAFTKSFVLVLICDSNFFQYWRYDIFHSSEC